MGFILDVTRRGSAGLFIISALSYPIPRSPISAFSYLVPKYSDKSEYSGFYAFARNIAVGNMYRIPINFSMGRFPNNSRHFVTKSFDPNIPPNKSVERGVF